MKPSDVQHATHVELLDGGIARVVSRWGIDEEGHLAPPSAGGFGVVTETGRRVDMWSARRYFRDDPAPPAVPFRAIPQADPDFEVLRAKVTAQFSQMLAYLAKR